MEIKTGAGPALAALDGLPGEGAGAGGATGERTFLLVLTHGAGGSPDTPDVLAVRDTGLALGAVTALVTQPYRVRGARAPGSAAKQDAAWAEIVAALRARVHAELLRTVPSPSGDAEIPLVQGGRSNGARVVCRTARAVGARAVIALAFPLHPPGQPERSRVTELRAAGTSVLVLNGARDPFGVPDGDAATRVIVLPGEVHALSKNPAAIREAATSWLDSVLPGSVFPGSARVSPGFPGADPR